MIVTEPNTTCYAGIAFWNTNDDWSFNEFSIKQSDQNGKCEWEWEIPSDAKDGIGEFRGFVKNDNQRTDFVPKTFCIVRCP